MPFDAADDDEDDVDDDDDGEWGSACEGAQFGQYLGRRCWRVVVSSKSIVLVRDERSQARLSDSDGDGDGDGDGMAIDIDASLVITTMRGSETTTRCGAVRGGATQHNDMVRRGAVRDDAAQPNII